MPISLRKGGFAGTEKRLLSLVPPWWGKAGGTHTLPVSSNSTRPQQHCHSLSRHICAISHFGLLLPLRKIIRKASKMSFPIHSQFKNQKQQKQNPVRGSLPHTYIPLSTALSFDYPGVYCGIKVIQWKKFCKESWDCLNCRSQKLEASFNRLWCFQGLGCALPSSIWLNGPSRGRKEISA